MATHSSILAWKTPWIEEPGRLQSTGHKRDTTKQLRTLSTYTCKHVNICVCVYICMYIYVCVYVCMYIYKNFLPA